MKDHIKKYCALGFKLFPVLIYLDKDKKVNKQPAIKDWQTLASSDPDVCLKTLFTGKFDGIGVVTGRASGITAIDIDVKNGNNGFHSLEMRGIELPATWAQTTPTGGEHRFYAYNEAVGQTVGVLAGIDIRNDGGFIVLAPTAFPDGKEYEWLSDQAPWEWTLADLPQTFIHLCQTPTKKVMEYPEVIKLGERNDVLYKMACSMRAKGLSEAEILGALTVTNSTRCTEPLSQEELEATVSSAGTKKKGNGIKKKNPLLLLISIIRKDSSLNNLFTYNEFTADIELAKAPPWNPLGAVGRIINDSDEIHLKVYLAEQYAFEPSTSLIHEAIVQLSFVNKTHPVREYIRGLSWDGTPRVEQWLIQSAGCNDTDYIRTVSRKVLVAAVARVFNPGCKFDYMLVLEGMGGIGKSMLVSALAGQWFTEINITAAEKDVVDKMRGMWILECSEMAGMRKADREHLKMFITIRKDRVRLAYRRNTEDFPRQSIFIGTMNPSGNNEWIGDDSGEKRRFWPVMCLGRVNLSWIKENRDQIIAECYHLFKNGEILYIEDENIIESAAREQETRQEGDAWLPIVEDWLKRCPAKFTNTDVLIMALGMEKHRAERYAQIRMGRILKRLNIDSKQEGHAKIRYYYRPEHAPIVLQEALFD